MNGFREIVGWSVLDINEVYYFLILLFFLGKLIRSLRIELRLKTVEDLLE